MTAHAPLRGQGIPHARELSIGHRYAVNL